MSTLLEDLGLRVCTAVDLDEALETLREEEPCTLLFLATLVSARDTCDTIQAIGSDSRYTQVPVVVMGAGHAGKLAMAAAQETVGDGTVVCLDVDEVAVARAIQLGLCDVGLTVDLRDPAGTLAAMAEAGVPAADLTVVVVNASGCEPSAIVATDAAFCRPERTTLVGSMTPVLTRSS